MKKLSIILIILGAAIAVMPLIGQIYTNNNEKRMVRDWLNETTVQEAYSSKADIATAEENFTELQDAFTSVRTQSAELSSVYSKPDSFKTKKLRKRAIRPSKQKVIGVIKIDKIKVLLPIVEGAGKEKLRLGIGHVPGTALPGQAGNCVLAGHRNYAFGRFFNRLDELKIGDKITLMTKEEEYVYKVFQKYVVSPKDVSVLMGTKDEKIITLITCTPPNSSTHRLIVCARLGNIRNI